MEPPAKRNYSKPYDGSPSSYHREAQCQDVWHPWMRNQAAQVASHLAACSRLPKDAPTLAERAAPTHDSSRPGDKEPWDSADPAQVSGFIAVPNMHVAISDTVLCCSLCGCSLSRSLMKRCRQHFQRGRPRSRSIQSVESGNLSDYAGRNIVSSSNCTPVMGSAMLFASIPLGAGLSLADLRQRADIE